MRIYRDTETGKCISEHDLMREYLILRAEGETEAYNFSDYIANCTEKNGTLEIVR